MQTLFEHSASDPKYQPLAERMRPRTLDEVLGQDQLVSLFKTLAAEQHLPSMILWGPPGSGKTTLASALARSGNYHFEALSAVSATVKDIRQLFQTAQQYRQRGRRMLLFLDEIHRFNKAQQDALLSALETGLFTLIGATTENPSFTLTSALLSRCTVYRLQRLQKHHIQQLIQRALEQDPVLQQYQVTITDWESVFQYCGGDARKALNLLELAVAEQHSSSTSTIVLDREVIQRITGYQLPNYEHHQSERYDTISAFIKSLRGSDPDAAILWLAKMLEAGEDPLFIARRLLIFASEDIGNADPLALILANATYQAVGVIGMPEARIILAQTTTYCAAAPKSNASYQAIEQATALCRSHSTIVVPLHLRNASTPLLKQEGYGAEYQYPHHFPGHFVAQNYFPENVSEQRFYSPSMEGMEAMLAKRLRQHWPHRYSGVGDKPPTKTDPED